VGLGRDGEADGGIAARQEARQPPLQRPALKQDMAIAAAAAQADVGSEPVDKPLAAAARMGAAQGYYVAKPEFDDLGPG
jgi:hypothetical protein